MKKKKHEVSSLTESTSLSGMRDACNELSENHSPAPQKTSFNFREKLHLLLKDNRKLSVRATLALLCSIAFAFTFIVFGPFELYISNMQYIGFQFQQMVLPMVLAGTAVAAALFILLMVLRGKVFNYALSALFAVTFAGYVQGNFLNVDYGALDGAAIVWSEFTESTLRNLLVWSAIAILVFALMYFSRKIWAVSIQLICIMLIGAQAVALCSLFVNTDFPDPDNNAFISTQGIYDVNENNNVVFFLLDRFDNEYADKMFEQNPEFQEKMNGFTYFRNFTGSYTRTMPSVTYLLTGIKCDYTIPFSEYFKKAWSESNFLSDIRKAGYKTRIYSDIPYVFGDAENLREKVDNFSSSELSINTKLLYKYMLKLSAYRYAPEALKPSFWLYTGDLAAITTTQNSTDTPYEINDTLFWKNYRENGLQVEDAKGAFAFYHMQGAHNPYYMDENGQPTSWSNDENGMYKQIAGNMNMIFEYIEDLKEKGLYDKTTIIISADHGMTGTQQTLDAERMLTLFLKPAGADTTVPLQISDKQICQDNLRASIISYFGLDTTEYGRTIESIGENEPITRYFWMQASDEERLHRDVEIVTYEITGDANDFSNWKEVNREPIKYPFYDSDETAGL